MNFLEIYRSLTEKIEKITSPRCDVCGKSIPWKTMSKTKQTSSGFFTSEFYQSDNGDKVIVDSFISMNDSGGYMRESSIGMCGTCILWWDQSPMDPRLYEK